MNDDQRSQFDFWLLEPEPGREDRVSAEEELEDFVDFMSAYSSG